MIDLHSALMTIGSAEMYCILIRSREITVLTKTPNQRNTKENYEVGHGLRRSIFVELLLFVPVSCALLLLTVIPVVDRKWLSSNFPTDLRASVFGLMGIVSYNFPFHLLRKVATNVALRTITEFAEIAQSALQK